MSGLQLANAFETPIILDSLAEAGSLNAALTNRITDKRAAEPGVRKSNWNGWQSDTDMLAWGGPEAQRLADHFLSLCNNFTAPGSAPFQWSIEMWANVAGEGAANESHVHPGAVWSAVYYVDDGYAGDGDRVLGGELVLYDPRMPFVRMLPFDLRYRRPDGTAADSQISIRPTTGRLVMFPPWLYHSVHPFHGQGTRISIAMNANAIPAR